MAVFATSASRDAGGEESGAGADRRSLWIGVDRARHRFVVGFPRRPEDVRGDHITLVLADVGQRPQSSDVSDRPQTFRRSQLRVDWHSVGIRCYSNGLEAHASDSGAPTGRNEKPVAAQFAAVIQHHDVVLAVPPGGGDRRGQFELDALAEQSLAKRLTQWCRLPGEDMFASLDDGRVAAETVDRLGHLHPDRASAEDEQATWNHLHAGRFAIGPHALELGQARNRRKDRVGSVGEDDVLGGVAGAVDVDDARARQTPAAAQ